MMNATRGEPFTIDVSFDCDVALLEDFTLYFRQRGAVVLTKSGKDAEIDAGGRRAYITLSGGETAQFGALDPVYVQVRAVLADGAALHSETEEINIVDVLDAEEGRR